MMTLLRPFVLIIAGLSLANPVFAQSDSLSARQIVQRAIDSDGGDRLLDSVNAMDDVHMLITPDNDSIFLAVKRSGFNKYLVSALSVTHENSTTIYNNGKAAGMG